MTPATDKLTLRDYALLAVMALCFFLPGLSTLPPVDRDEPRYTQATTQMLETGDFLDIRFMDQVRYKQPAGIYWLQAASVSLFGDVHKHKIWAHRLPSVLNGMIAVLLASWIGCAFFGRKAGIASGILLAACLSLTFEAHIAKTDATLCMLILVCQAALVRMRLDAAANRPAAWAPAILFWVFLGLGIMVKGPIPILVTGATVAATALWERSWDLPRRLRAFPLVLVPLLIALPWLIAIQIKSHGQFMQLAAGKNFAGKITSGQESHGGPPGYHLALFNLMFWPSSLFAVAAIPAVWTNRTDPRVRFLVSWIVPTWIVMELTATKLPHYPLPTYPAIAALTAGVWFGGLATTPGKVAKALGRAYAVLWTIVGVLVAAAPAVLLIKLEHHTDPVAIGLGVLSIAGTLACLVFLLQGHNDRALGAAAVAALLAWGNLFGWSAARVESMWLSPRIVAAVKANAPCPHPVLASAPFQEASLAYLAGTGTEFVPPAQVADHLKIDPACGLALVGTKEYPAFAAELAVDGIAAQKVAEIDGHNYAKALMKPVALSLYRAAIPAAGSSPSAASPKTLP
jgi:4-amino-4-deoxy-L-arabinose transferase-like glycosyltransferase